ncbi:MAG: HPr kinase/phosphorylase, partial [Gemmatimonadota bacterium]
MQALTVEALYADKREPLDLELLTDEVSLGRAIEAPTLSSAGLILTGFKERMPKGRLQVLGETEVSYLRSLDAADLDDVLDRLFSIDMPALMVTKGLDVPARLLDRAAGLG